MLFSVNMLRATGPDYLGIQIMVVYSLALTGFIVNRILSRCVGHYIRFKRDADESNEDVIYNLPKSGPFRGL